MARFVVFVHGTGVRAKSFNATVGVLSKVFARRFPGLDLRPCYWADAEGAREPSGKSVPGYATSGGGVTDAEGERLAMWAVLYTDPWRELRLLGLEAPTGTRANPRAEPPGSKFLREVTQWRPSAKARELLIEYRLSGAFDQALEQACKSTELLQAAKTAEADAHAHRYVLARALVAHSLGHADTAEPALTGDDRDVLLETVARDLDAVRKKAPRWVKDRAMSMTTKRLLARRGGITDRITPFAGDVLRYQVRGDGLRRLIHRTIADLPGTAPVTLLGHSLGGIACVDMLAMQPHPRVDRLITVGSQAGYLHEIGALACAEPDEALPAHFPDRWLNIHDPADLLSYPAQGAFGTRVTDVVVANGQPFPLSHSAYWNNAEVWEAATSWIG